MRFCHFNVLSRKIPVHRFLLFVLLSLLLFPSLTQAASSSDAGVSGEFACPDCNVILISVTNLRADHLLVYGYNRNTAPALSRLAKKSIVFDQAFSVASWTLPVAASVQTSLYPFQHQVMVRVMDEKIASVGVVQKRLATDKLTLFDILKKNGYLTASLNGAADYLPEFGFTDRADLNLSFSIDPSNRWGRYGSAMQVIPKAIDWVQENQAKKFFLQLQVYDAHCPFAYPRENAMFDPGYKGGVDFTRCYWTFDRTDPVVVTKKGVTEKYYTVKSQDASVLCPKGRCSNDPSKNEELDPYSFVLSERDIRHMLALYDGEIHNVDAQLEQLLAALKKMNLLKRTIIVFFSEHGDMFGKYGRFMRGGPIRGTFYDDVLRVPLVIYHPRLKAMRIKSPVTVLDVAPSLLGFLNIPVPRQFVGDSLLPLLKGKKIDKKVFAGSVFIPDVNIIYNTVKGKAVPEYFRGGTVVTAVRDKAFKLIRETVIVPPVAQKGIAAQVDTQYELYDLAKDPQELSDIATRFPETVKKMSADIDEWFFARMGNRYDLFVENIKQQMFSATIKSGR